MHACRSAEANFKSSIIVLTSVIISHAIVTNFVWFVENIEIFKCENSIINIYNNIFENDRPCSHSEISNGERLFGSTV